MTDIRCNSKKHAELINPQIIEVKCNSRFCGAEPGIVVIHQFNTTTGALVSTNTYKNPPKGSEPK